MNRVLESERMLIREGEFSILLTYLKKYTEREEENEAKIRVIKKEGWTKEEEMNGGVRFWGIFGEIEVSKSRYLIYLKEASRVGSIHGKPVFEATAGGAICIEGKNDGLVHELISDFFKTPGLYFSEENLAEVGAKDNTDFIFNFIPLSKFNQNHKDCGMFGVKAIQGYFGNAHLLGSLPLRCTLLSRRSWRNAGTRYFSRGADALGNCANTVETLFITEYLGKENIFLQCRGSIPLLWEQKTNLSYKPPVKMGEEEGSRAVFKKHMEVMKKRYGKFFVLSLLDEGGHEKELNSAFISEMKRQGTEFYSVDYHRMIKDSSTQTGFRKRLKNILSTGSVIRTNCVDCLDRTNVVQSKISKIKMVEQLDLVEYSTGKTVLDIDDYLEEKESKKVAQIWNNNANTLSMQYTGTSALKNDLTEHGVRTIRGLIQDAISSGRRYVNNNFTDGRVQETIEMVTGVRNVLGNCFRGDRALLAVLAASIGLASLAIFLHQEMGIFVSVVLVALAKVVISKGQVYLSPRYRRSARAKEGRA